MVSPNNRWLARVLAILEQLSGAIGGGGIIIAQPVDVEIAASLPAGTNNIGDVDIASQDAAAAHVHEPAANTAAVITLAAAGAGVSNVLGEITWSYDNVPTGGALTIQDGAATVWKFDITTSGPGPHLFNPPMKGSANTAMVITLAAGGGGVSGIVAAHAWTE